MKTRTLLSTAWLAVSLALIASGMVLAVIAPNGAPGVIVCVVGLCSWGAWAEVGAR